MRPTLLLIGATLLVAWWLVLPRLTDAKTAQARAASLQSRLGTAEQRLQARRRREQVLTTDISTFNRRIERLQSRVQRLDLRVREGRARLSRSRDDLEAVRSDLRAQRRRLLRLRARLTRARGLLGRRLAELYRAGRPDLITVIFTSRGFAQLLERTEFLQRISEADGKIITAVKVARVDARTATQRLLGLERRQAVATQRISASVDQIQDAQRAASTTRDGYAAVVSTKRRSLARVRVSRAQLQSEVAALSRQQARIRRTLQRSSGPAPAVGQPQGPAQAPTRSGGVLIWPVNGVITSPFCERRSYEACHPGLDIAVPEGTPIRAAADGVVLLMQPTAASGGYGNYTCLRHSGALSTCYAHQQRFATRQGARVRRGDVIGYVGNTGRSFGAHLHFEVRVNGSVANPTNYL